MIRSVPYPISCGILSDFEILHKVEDIFSVSGQLHWRTTQDRNRSFAKFYEVHLAPIGSSRRALPRSGPFRHVWWSLHHIASSVDRLLNGDLVLVGDRASNFDRLFISGGRKPATAATTIQHIGGPPEGIGLYDRAGVSVWLVTLF